MPGTMACGTTASISSPESERRLMALETSNTPACGADLDLQAWSSFSFPATEEDKTW